jgi:hypothetical protein
MVPGCYPRSTGGKICFTNPAGRRLFAKDKDIDLFEKDLLEFVVPNQKEILPQRIRQAVFSDEN